VNGNHIRFWEVESEAELDRKHLEVCDECQRQAEIYRLLVVQLSRLPRIEAPFFFASRVQNLISEARPSLVYYFQRTAAHLAPLLTLLIVVTSVLIHSISQEPNGQTVTSGNPAVVLEESAFPEVSVENMIAELDEGPNR
jgi:hypothetical protein